MAVGLECKVGVYGCIVNPNLHLNLNLRLRYLGIWHYMFP